MDRPALTVIIPAYNEAPTIAALLDAVLAAPFDKQVVAVDDGSHDGTASEMMAWSDRTGFPLQIVQCPVNRGKGSAIREGLALAEGQVTLVQDADLEYDTRDYEAVVRPILDGRAEVVYGSRYLRPEAPRPWTINRVCVCLLNLAVRVLFGRRLTDEATCYKAFRTELLRSLELRCRRFEFCPEVTAKLCLAGVPILEVPVRYRPRAHADGKKIRWWDGVEAFATLLRWRLRGFRPSTLAAPAPAPPAFGSGDDQAVGWLPGPPRLTAK
jgi:glycosyltransferase involved in cell wall biosynthesis